MSFREINMHRAILFLFDQQILFLIKHKDKLQVDISDDVCNLFYLTHELF